MIYLSVAIGSALGGMARYWLSEAMIAWVGPAFPWGTLVINVVGSLVIGWFFVLSGGNPERFIGTPEMRSFVMVGLCGGFTTFSAFSLQTLRLLQAGELMRAGAYVAASVLLCLMFVWIGAMLGETMITPPDKS